MDRYSLNWFDTDGPGYLAQQPGRCVLHFHQPYSLPVERDKAIRAEPASFIGDNAVSEISTCIQQSQSGLCCGPVYSDVRAVRPAPDRFADLARRNLVALRQHPNQLAERRYRQRNQVCVLQRCLGGSALLRVVPGNSANEHISIGRDFHRLPAQPRAAILFISSIDRDGPCFFFKKLKASEILPVGRTAFTSIRPSGSLSTAIFSPG